LNQDKNVPEPIFLSRAMCYSEEIKFPFSDKTFKKDNFGILVVLIDVLSIICILIFIYVIGVRQNEFIEAYKADTIQMDDYTIKVKNLPKDGAFDHEELILKAKLWEHF